MLWAVEGKASVAWSFNLQPSGEPERTVVPENVVMDALQRGLVDLGRLRKELLQGLRLVIVSISTSMHVNMKFLERLRWGIELFCCEEGPEQIN